MKLLNLFKRFLDSFDVLTPGVTGYACAYGSTDQQTLQQLIVLQ